MTQWHEKSETMYQMEWLQTENWHAGTEQTPEIISARESSILCCLSFGPCLINRLAFSAALKLNASGYSSV